MPHPLPPLLVRVARRLTEAVDIVSLELTSLDGNPLPPFSAGSHIDVLIDVLVGDDTVRQYSLCNPPSERHRYLIAVLRDPKSRGGSVGVHEHIREGDVIRISEPRNHFALVPARRTLLLAGGIGITPILCMAEQLHQAGADFEMHYCARSPDRMAFRDRIAASGFASKCQWHFDDGEPSQKFDAASVLASKGDDVHLFVCGPGGFIDHVVESAKCTGWLAANIHVEHFAAAAIDTSKDGSFQIKIASTGELFDVPADCSVVQVLEQNGIDVPVSCEQGVCGTCLMRVIDGQPDHRDMFLTDDEKAANKQFTPCCSRSLSPVLVLDI